MSSHATSAGRSLFSQLWTWTIGRNIYFATTKKTVPRLPATHRLDVAGTGMAAERASIRHLDRRRGLDNEK